MSINRTNIWSIWDHDTKTYETETRTSWDRDRDQEQLLWDRERDQKSGLETLTSLRISCIDKAALT